MRPPRPVAAWSDFHSGLYRRREEIEELQLARLRELVVFAYENVPFYRKRFDAVRFRPSQLRTIADLAAIPITTRADIQATPPEDLIARGSDLRTLLPSRTSGSTGAALTVYRSRPEEWVASFARVRPWLHHGLRIDDHILTISAYPPSGRKRRWRRSVPLLRRWNVNVLEDEELLAESFRQLSPSVLYGYSYLVARLARLARERNIRTPRLRLVATSGDLLLAQFQRNIRATWNVDPLDIYSSSELGDMAWQCERREGYHLNSDHFVFEFLHNAHSVEPGEHGELVVTNLYRYSMPLIRYSHGDVGVPAEGPCPCGVRLPMMSALEGRTLNAVLLPGGGVFIGFNRLMSDIPEIVRYQVVQRALDRFDVSVVLAPSSSSAVLATAAADLHRHLGEDVHIDVRSVEESALIRTGGKVPAVIPLSKVDFGNVT